MMQFENIDYIDFIKGFAIISVILLHTLSHDILISSFAIFHIWQAVPLFILISFFLGFRSIKQKQLSILDYYSKKRLINLFKRVVVPLLFVVFIEIVFFYFTDDFSKIKKTLMFLGYGPGRYYFWCYIQIWLMIPIVYYLISKRGLLSGGCIILIINELLIIAYSFLSRYFESQAVDLYSFTCVRYLFLSVLGYMILENKTKMKYVIPLSVLSVVWLISLIYYHVSFSPIIYSGNWTTQNWPAFFYTLLLFLFLAFIGNRLSETIIGKFFGKLGRASWEIFLLQMMILGLLPKGLLNISNSDTINLIVLILFVMFFSITPALIYHRVLNKHNNRSSEVVENKENE